MCTYTCVHTHACTSLIYYLKRKYTHTLRKNAVSKKTYVIAVGILEMFLSKSIAYYSKVVAIKCFTNSHRLENIS